MNNIAALAVALGEAGQPEFKTYAQQILKNAKTLATNLLTANCKLVTGGTDNHMLIVDCMASFGADGKTIEETLDAVGITASKSTIPDDPLPPYRPSGLRLGTPAMTTRGATEMDMARIAGWIVDAARAREDQVKLAAIRKEVKEFCLAHPVPGIN